MFILRSLGVWPDWAIFKFRGNLFTFRIGPNFWWLLGLFQKITLQVKTTVDNFEQLSAEIGQLFSQADRLT